MAPVHRYKRFENSLVQKVKTAAKALAKGLGGVFFSLFRAITRRYTIVLVPHSEKKVYNFHVSAFSIMCFVLILTGIAGAFFWYGASYNNTRGVLADKDGRLKEVQANLDELRDETAYLMRNAGTFKKAVSDTFKGLGTDFGGQGGASSGAGEDLDSFFDIRETPEGSLQEAADLRRLGEYLHSVEEPLRQVGSLLDSQSTLLTEIPSIWPIRGGIGHVSMFFGQNINPFTGQYYIHKGIDLSTYRQGDPIVATADGQVVLVEYDQSGLGNNVIIRHKHGFYTRYGHMQYFRVKLGQQVQQGDVIGYIGNTGLSTGPHVHYEVHIGSDVVDPYKYITIRSSIARPAR